MKTRDNKLISMLITPLALVSIIGAAAVVVTGLIAPETAYARRNLTAAQCAAEYARNPGGTTPITGVADGTRGAILEENRESRAAAREAYEECMEKAWGPGAMKVAPTRVHRSGIVQSQTVRKARPQKRIPRRSLVSRPIKKTKKTGSNISKPLHDTQLSIIRKTGG